MNFHNVETQTAKMHFAESFPRVYRLHNQIKNIVLMMLLVPMSFVASAADLQANMTVSQSNRNYSCPRNKGLLNQARIFSKARSGFE